MTDAATRVRFLVCRQVLAPPRPSCSRCCTVQVELALAGMFPKAEILPFGSAINGFGSDGSDQDMLLLLDREQQQQDCRLVFHAKAAVYGGERAQVQRNCEEVASIIQAFLPGCQNVQKILGARVPIIKYTHQVQCS